jgi:hypothetical protein
MGEKATAFGKGGCGCMIAFAAVGFMALLFGGRVYIDLGGAIFLFVIGGIIGLVCLWIYNNGKRDAGGHFDE